MPGYVYPKVVVLCRNSEGQAEFHACAPEVTPDELAEGTHYRLAKENANSKGYEGPMLAFDATDPAASQLMTIFNWLSNK